MTTSTPLILFIAGAGVLQAILLAALLYFHPKSDRSVTSFLSLHILTISIFMLMPVSEYFFSWRSLAYLLPFQYLIGPFLYFYIRSFKGAITWRIAWPHCLLFIIIAGLMAFYYLPWVSEYPAANKPPTEILLASITYVIVFTRNIQMLAYYFICRRILNRYQRSINQLYSETSKINLNWIKWLLNGFLFLIITVLALIYFVVSNPENFSSFILINTAVITPYIYVVAIKGIGQPTLWQIQPGASKKKIETEINEVEALEAHTKKGNENLLTTKKLPEAILREVISRITLLMEQDKIYQEPELTLQALSEKLKIPSYQLSQVINDGMKKSFYDLINGYRVKEAKRLLLDSKNQNYTVLSVGFDAGFNSKTTFNTVFKKFTGFTPTEFRERNKVELV
jgi:AraC-like DNA-binding protein